MGADMGDRVFCEFHGHSPFSYLEENNQSKQPMARRRYTTSWKRQSMSSKKSTGNGWWGDSIGGLSFGCRGWLVDLGWSGVGFGTAYRRRSPDVASAACRSGRSLSAASTTLWRRPTQKINLLQQSERKQGRSPQVACTQLHKSLYMLKNAKKVKYEWPTDGSTDGPTQTYRVACSWLKIMDVHTKMIRAQAVKDEKRTWWQVDCN